MTSKSSSAVALDSPADTSLTSDSDTLASYVTHYVKENNRRYHAYQAGSYWGPNDESANEGQDLAHAMYFLTLDKKLYLAPIYEPKRVLDVGTGTGIWAIEMADLHPNTQITGIDLSPIQPDLVPLNCVFEVDDATLKWTWEESYFDFVHIREMFGSVPDWDFMAREALRCIKPGGFVEIVEHSTCVFSDDGTVTPGSPLDTWGKTIYDIGQKWGKTFDTWKESRSILDRAGFVNIVDRRFKWPMNGWHSDPKLNQLGRLNEIRMIENLEAFTIRLLTSVGQMTSEEAHVFLAQIRLAIKDKSVHGYLEISVVYGMKPC